MLWAMRQGFTLLELVLVLAVVGILTGLALPPLSHFLDRIEVEAAATHLIAAHQRARLLAIARGQVTRLTINPDSLRIFLRADVTPHWSEAGPASSRVGLTGSPHQFTFSPEGFTLGLSNASLQLTRGGSRRVVIFSRLGRVRVLR